MIALTPTLPTYQEITAPAADYAQGLFTDILPWALIGTGLLLGGLIVFWLGHSIKDAFSYFLEKREKNKFD